jgi:pyridinium-3,5-biscarboxylic acid mononucleotide synthase
VKDILRRLVAGELTEEEAMAELRAIQLDELSGRARLDLGRFLRRGIPEVILAPGKTPEDAATLVVAMAGRQGQGLVSRLSADHRAALDRAVVKAGMDLVAYGAAARVVKPGFQPEPVEGKVAVLTAGTSDMLVAEEARMVVEAAGLRVRMEADLGVAGLHRFVGPLASILEWGADALIVAAGMDGVLPGLVAGLVAVPVIGLPVSTGYGRGGAGEAALLTMLQSCSTGLTVVNIDNGIGAGTAAVLMAARAAARAAQSQVAPSIGAAPEQTSRPGLPDRPR